MQKLYGKELVTAVKTNAKLISAALMLAMSLVMLVGASMAWFTVSTAPEITGFQVNLYTDLDLLVSKDGPERGFSQSVSSGQVTTPNRPDPELGEGQTAYENPYSIDKLASYAPLKPISTVDGKNWYMPNYTADGFLESVDTFLPATAQNVNVILDESQKGTDDYFKKNNLGYYIYADIWLKTENQQGVSVSLSVPKDKDSLQGWEKGEGDFGQLHGNKYGTYALGKYAVVGQTETEDGKTNIVAEIDNDVQTALRIGFQELDAKDQPAAGTKFYIYEPNADQRSSLAKKPKTGDSDEHTYIIGYAIEANGSNYQSGNYIKTRPIGKGADGKPTVVDIKPEQLLVQKQSSWGDTITTNYATPSSADVATFGKFLNSHNLYSQLNQPNAGVSLNVSSWDGDLSSENTIVDLEPGIPKKLRVYFWLEGQDVDCWNDIASGSFLVNLEFAVRPRTS